MGWDDLKKYGQQQMARSAAAVAKGKMNDVPMGSDQMKRLQGHFNDFKRINRKVTKDLRRSGR